MYIGASLFAVFLRIWKARSAGKSQAAETSVVSDSTGQPDCEGRVSGCVSDSDAYFKVGKVRLWKRVCFFFFFSAWNSVQSMHIIQLVSGLLIFLWSFVILAFYRRFFHGDTNLIYSILIWILQSTCFVFFEFTLEYQFTCNSLVWIASSVSWWPISSNLCRVLIIPKPWHRHFDHHG